eukprot:m.34228 g.34228  ORF g.34228 m.34228 type:complete len:1156 (-) comp9750_c0_seq1:1510-4977(-)
MGQKASKQRDSRAQEEGSEESDALVELGRFGASYLGTATLDGTTQGDERAVEATQRILNARNPKRKVQLLVSNKAVMIHSPKGDVLVTTPYHQLAYVTLLGKKRDLVLYIQNSRTQIVSAHLFKCKTKLAARIPQLIQEACSTASRPTKRKAWSDSDSGTPQPSFATSGATPSSSSAAAASPMTKTGPADRLEEEVEDEEGAEDGVGALPAIPKGKSKNITRRESTASMGYVAPTVQSFKGHYLGHTAVTEPGDVGVVSKSVKALKVNKPCPVTIHVSSEEIRIVGRNGKGDVLQRALPSELRYHEADKALFSFITEDREQIRFCHSVKLKNHTICKKLRDVVGVAIVDASNAADAADDAEGSERSRLARARSVAATSSPKRDKSTVIAIYEAQYLGSVPVLEKTGEEVCESAAISLLTTKPAPTVVAISISGEGAKVVEALTSEVITAVFISNITFTTVVSNPRVLKKDKSKGVRTSDALFVFIAHDPRLERKTCHIFRAGVRAQKLCVALSEAFKVAFEETKRQRNNPFAATSKQREVPKGELFKKQIHRRDLLPIRVLGMGQFGEVYLAEQVVKQGRGENGTNKIKRAVKLLRNAASVADKTEFLREAETMLKLEHQNIVQMAGVAVQQRPWLCVLEYMEYGDLRAVLRACKEKNLQLAFLEQLKFAAQIATGMDYLSSQHLVHMDLAARNCLLGANNLVKIADFGLTRPCKEGKDYFRLTVTLKLPIKWMAIESMDEKLFSSKSDVWAFGVTCWEIMAYGALPYGTIKNMEIQVKVREGLRLSCPPNCPKEFYALLCKCWHPIWRERPSFDLLRKYIMKFGRDAKASSPPLRDIGRALRIWSPENATEYERRVEAAQRKAEQTKQPASAVFDDEEGEAASASDSQPAEAERSGAMDDEQVHVQLGQISPSKPVLVLSGLGGGGGGDEANGADHPGVLVLDSSKQTDQEQQEDEDEEDGQHQSVPRTSNPSEAGGHEVSSAPKVEPAPAATSPRVLVLQPIDNDSSGDNDSADSEAPTAPSSLPRTASSNSFSAGAQQGQAGDEDGSEEGDEVEDTPTLMIVRGHAPISDASEPWSAPGKQITLEAQTDSSTVLDVDEVVTGSLATNASDGVAGQSARTITFDFGGSSVADAMDLWDESDDDNDEDAARATF